MEDKEAWEKYKELVRKEQLDLKRKQLEHFKQQVKKDFDFCTNGIEYYLEKSFPDIYGDKQ